MMLRPFIPSDASTVLSWIQDETTFRRWSADRYGHYPITPEEMIAQYDSPVMFPLIAADDGVPVGHLSLRRPGDDRQILRAGFIVLDPHRRGKGDGKTMLRLAMQEAKEHHGAKKLTLGVFADNVPARRCYEAVGLQYTGEETTYNINNTPWVCLEMAVTL